ncbi:hypothetical protein A7X67_06975 [Clostridium sp. W14A]|nr:hypothetical protein A7X67_06975 [Clostridium sp. W14A]
MFYKRSKGKSPAAKAGLSRKFLTKKDPQKRFSRIRRGKITQEAFYERSEQTRKRREQCASRKTALEEFKKLMENPTFAINCSRRVYGGCFTVFSGGLFGPRLR